jgi:hypothetical protein
MSIGRVSYPLNRDDDHKELEDHKFRQSLSAAHVVLQCTLKAEDRDKSSDSGNQFKGLYLYSISDTASSAEEESNSLPRRVQSVAYSTSHSRRRLQA